MKTFVLLFVACLLAACASDPDWTHPTKDADEWKLDAADCERFFSATDKGLEACLEKKGWRKVK